MNEIQQLLVDYGDFRRKSEAQQYIDTGDTLELMARMHNLIVSVFPHEVRHLAELEDKPIAAHNHSLGIDCGSTCPRFVEILHDIARRNPDLEVDGIPGEQVIAGLSNLRDDVERDGNLGEVIDRRVQVYGDPVAGFASIAAMWTEYLDFPVQAHQVPMMMLLMKVVRSKTSPDYSDHSDDIEGYLDIFRKVIGEDMIQARSVNEYIEKKWPGEA